MEDDINDLLIKARDNISDNVDKQTEFNYRKALEESMKELQNLKTINQEFIDIRNVAIKNLYGHHSQTTSPREPLLNSPQDQAAE